MNLIFFCGAVLSVFNSVLIFRKMAYILVKNHTNFSDEQKDRMLMPVITTTIINLMCFLLMISSSFVDFFFHPFSFLHFILGTLPEMLLPVWHNIQRFCFDWRKLNILNSSLALGINGSFDIRLTFWYFNKVPFCCWKESA